MGIPGGIALLPFIGGGPIGPLFFSGGIPPFGAFCSIGLPIGDALILLIVDNGLLPSRVPLAPMFGEFIPKCGLALPIRFPFGPMFGEFIAIFGLELFIRVPFGEFMPKCAFGPTPICAN